MAHTKRPCPGRGFLLVAGFAVTLGGQAFAEITTNRTAILKAQYLEQTGAAERVDAADRLRTLTFEVQAAACHYYNDVDTKESRELLTESKLEVRALLAALRDGDAKRGIIGEETRGKTLLHIEDMDEFWDRIEPHVLTLLDKQDDTAAITAIKAETPGFFAASDVLLADITGEYANPVELLQVDALMLDVAGRQSMLTQKIGAIACEIWTGYGSDSLIADLKEAIGMFELGTAALLDGMPELGIKPAPTPQIADELRAVRADWDIAAGHLAAIMEDKSTREMQDDLYRRLNDKMRKMDEIVHLYVKFSKHQYD